MLADRSDLEPVLDDVAPGEWVPDGSPGRAHGGSILLALVLALGAVPLALVLHRQVVDARAELAAAQQVRADATRAREEADARLRAGAIAEAERARAAQRAAEGERREATANRFVLRDPIVTLPAAIAVCRADDLEVIPSGNPVQGVQVVNRGDRPCGLVDHPVLQGRGEGGGWRTIPVLPSVASSSTDGPDWNGVLPVGWAVGMTIASSPPLRSGECVTGAAPVEDFTGLRLVLSPEAKPLVVPDVSFSSGPCRPEVLLWGYDQHSG